MVVDLGGEVSNDKKPKRENELIFYLSRVSAPLHMLGKINALSQVFEDYDIATIEELKERLKK